METATFKKSWLDAIAFLSKAMQNRIILIVTRYQLTGELPEKMSKTILCAVRFIFAELGLDLTNIVNKPNTKVEETKNIETRLEETPQTSTEVHTPTPTEAKTPIIEPKPIVGKLPRKMKKALKKALARKVAA